MRPRFQILPTWPGVPHAKRCFLPPPVKEVGYSLLLLVLVLFLLLLFVYYHSLIISVVGITMFEENNISDYAYGVEDIHK